MRKKIAKVRSVSSKIFVLSGILVSIFGIAEIMITPLIAVAKTAEQMQQTGRTEDVREIEQIEGTEPTASTEKKAQAATIDYTSQALAQLKTLVEYDADLSPKSDSEILASDDTKLLLLQREFVSRVGYENLTKFVGESEANAEVLNWLMGSKDNLEEYLLGGNPEGTQTDRNALYPKALGILSTLYQEYKEDLTDPENGDVYKRMLMAFSLAYTVDDAVNHWQTVEVYMMPKPNETARRTPTDPVVRYSLFKNLFTQGYTAENISTYFEKDLFRDLEVEEMRWVINTRTGDKDIPWINWYTQKVKTGNSAYGPLDEATGLRGPNLTGYMNPYTYINYSGGIRWNYEDHAYYEAESTHCALSSVGNMNPQYGEGKGYARGENCNTKYGLKPFGIATGQDQYLHQWIIWEEDGVCGSIAGVGTNIQMAYGIPSSLVSQPGHAAYFQSNTELEDWKDGPKLRRWNIGNSVTSWGNSYKGERMPLDWGTKYDGRYTDSNNASYLLLAQRALDNFDKFKNSAYYNFLANLRSSDEQKMAAYTSAVKELPYNLDSWAGIVDLALRDSKLMDKDFYDLAEAIMKNLEEFPLPMHDLLKKFSHRMESHQIAYNNSLNELLTKQANLKVEDNTDYFQAQAVKEIANYLLGKQENTDIASFSFDGDNAMQLRLEGTFREHKTPFEYSIDASKDDLQSGTWIQVNDGSTVDVDLSAVAGQLTHTKDIMVHALATTLEPKNVYTIDLLPPAKQNITNNDLERRVVGIDEESAEWVQIEAPSAEYEESEPYWQLFICANYDNVPEACENANNLEWTKFSDKQPVISDQGNKLETNFFSDTGDLYVRTAATGIYTKSDPVNVLFGPKVDDPKKTYLPNSMMEVSSSLGGVEDDPTLANLLDGSRDTAWLSDPEDKEKYVLYKLDQPVLLSSIDYVSKQSADTKFGDITIAKLEVSLDGVNYRTVSDNISWPIVRDTEKHTYQYSLDRPEYAKYIRITGLQTHININAAGETVAFDRTHVSMYNFYQDTTAKIDIALLDDLVEVEGGGFTYNGNEQRPVVKVGDYDGSTLEANRDFAVAYEDNRNAGMAKIKISGAGDRYQGELTREFTINKAEQPPILPSDSYEASESASRLSDVQLPNGWHWEKGDQALVPGESVTAMALYDDANNYHNASKAVEVVVPARANVEPDPTNPENIPSQPGTADGQTGNNHAAMNPAPIESVIAFLSVDEMSSGDYVYSTDAMSQNGVGSNAAEDNATDGAKPQTSDTTSFTSETSTQEGPEQPISNRNIVSLIIAGAVILIGLGALWLYAKKR